MHVTKPSIPVTDSRFEYTPACKTDIRKTWAKSGHWPFPTAPIDHTKDYSKVERRLAEERRREERDSLGDALF